MPSRLPAVVYPLTVAVFGRFLVSGCSVVPLLSGRDAPVTVVATSQVPGVGSSQGESGSDGGTPDSTEPEIVSDTAVSNVEFGNLQCCRVPNHGTVFGGDTDQRMNSVVAAGPGLIAVGTGGNRDAAVWVAGP